MLTCLADVEGEERDPEALEPPDGVGQEPVGDEALARLVQGAAVNEMKGGGGGGMCMCVCVCWGEGRASVHPSN